MTMPAFPRACQTRPESPSVECARSSALESTIIYGIVEGNQASFSVENLGRPHPMTYTMNPMTRFLPMMVYGIAQLDRFKGYELS